MQTAYFTMALIPTEPPRTPRHQVRNRRASLGALRGSTVLMAVDVEKKKRPGAPSGEVKKSSSVKKGLSATG